LKNRSVSLLLILLILGVAAILTMRHFSSGTAIASAAKSKSQTNTIPSCNGDSSLPPTATTANGPKPHSVMLSWSPSIPVSDSPADVIKGYYVYRSQTSQKYADSNRLDSLPLIGTRCFDATVVPQATYYYVVKAVTAVGKQSLVSEEIKAVIPSP
jgi:uncharacterized protein (UPF0333 family)